MDEVDDSGGNQGQANSGDDDTDEDEACGSPVGDIEEKSEDGATPAATARDRRANDDHQRQGTPTIESFTVFLMHFFIKPVDDVFFFLGEGFCLLRRDEYQENDDDVDQQASQIDHLVFDAEFKNQKPFEQVYDEKRQQEIGNAVTFNEEIVQPDNEVIEFF